MDMFRSVMLIILIAGVLVISASALVGPKDSFLVKTIDNYVTVFRASDREKPYMNTGIDESMLPEADRLMLSVGISVDNETELWSILEDLGS